MKPRAPHKRRMLRSTSQNATINSLCTICIFVVNARNLKAENKKLIIMTSVLSHIIHLDMKYLMVKTLAGDTKYM